MKRAIAILCLTGMWVGIYARADVLGVKFAPEDDCTAAIVAEFDRAKTSIEYQLYNATSLPVCDALIGAHKRGVKVTILLDKRAQRSSTAKPHAASKRAARSTSMASTR